VSLPTEACARWQEIERALGAPGPVPDEVRRYLLDVAHLLNRAVEGDLLPGQRLTPKQAAALVPDVLGLTGRAIGAYRDERRKEGYGWLFETAKQEHLVKRRQIDNFAADLARRAKVTTRQIYRWGEWWRARNKN
jgi:hypothetical protein